MRAKIGWQQIFGMAATISLGVIYLFLWVQMIGNPVERTGTDFIAFYTAGRIAQENGTSQVYNISLQKKIQTQTVGFKLADGQVLLYNHMPFLIPVLFPLIGPDYVWSFTRWALLSIGIYLTATICLAKLYPETWARREKFLFSAAILTFFPFFISILLGQDSAILILGMTFLCLGLLKNNNSLAGVGLVLMLVRPHLCLSFSIPLFFFRRKVFFIFFILATALALMSLFLLGKTGVMDFKY